jgi:hypothetical protein
MSNMTQPLPVLTPEQQAQAIWAYLKAISDHNAASYNFGMCSTFNSFTGEKLVITPFDNPDQWQLSHG